MKLGVLLEILNKVLEYLRNSAIRRENKKAQEQRDAIENSPAEWFNGHFDGMPGNGEYSPPTDADKTDP